MCSPLRKSVVLKAGNNSNLYTLIQSTHTRETHLLCVPVKPNNGLICQFFAIQELYAACNAHFLAFVICIRVRGVGVQPRGEYNNLPKMIAKDRLSHNSVKRLVVKKRCIRIPKGEEVRRQHHVKLTLSCPWFRIVVSVHVEGSVSSSCAKQVTVLWKMFSSPHRAFVGLLCQVSESFLRVLCSHVKYVELIFQCCDKLKSWVMWKI